MAFCILTIKRPLGILSGRSSFMRSAGFTLIESLMATVVLAMVVSAVLVPFTASIQARQDSSIQIIAQRAAQSRMEYILSMPFADPDDSSNRNGGPETGEGNADHFDNMDDWHGYSDTIVNDGYEDLTCTVTVTYLTVSGQPVISPANCCQITVTVSSASDEIIKLSRLVYGDMESRQ